MREPAVSRSLVHYSNELDAKDNERKAERREYLYLEELDDADAMTLEIKPGVTLLGLVPQMCVALLVVERAYSLLNVHCVITAGDDGSHTEASEHYAGRALDFRTRDLEPDDVGPLIEHIQASLGRDYGVILEADHIHVHYRPQGPKVAST
jgi:hypothetical protein